MTGDLPRRIGFWGGSALMVGIILGSGIFLAPPAIAGMMGSPALVLAFWVAGGVPGSPARRAVDDEAARVPLRNFMVL